MQFPFTSYLDKTLNLLSHCFSEYLQPAEMSLEEIESRLGSLVQADTVSLLKSAAWKEQLEGLL